MAKFGTAGIRGPVAETLPPETVVVVGRAIAAEAKDVAIARDGRVTGEALLDAARAGLTSGGANVERLGILPTPALSFASRDRHGVMITASHNPPGDNGIKVFRDGVEIDRETERAIEERVAAGTRPVAWEQWGTTRGGRVLAEYREAVLTYLADHGSSLDGCAIAVDCGNGTGGLAAPVVLQRLDADVRALDARIDGHFPSRPSKPTPETLETLSEFVAAGPSDFGIAFDGDADRVVLVGGDGSIVHEDTVLAILAAHYVERSSCEDPVVVTTPNASTRIDRRVENFGGRVERTDLGALHEGIVEVETAAHSAETQVVFAGEPWKHIHPAFGGWIDGIVSAALVAKLIADAGDLRALRAPIREPPYRKRDVPCPESEKQRVLTALRSELPERYPDAEFDTRYGVRLRWPGEGWLLLRASGTEPMIRVYAEHERVDALVEGVLERLDAHLHPGA